MPRRLDAGAAGRALLEHMLRCDACRLTNAPCAIGEPLLQRACREDVAEDRSPCAGCDVRAACDVVHRRGSEAT